MVLRSKIFLEIRAMFLGNQDFIGRKVLYELINLVELPFRYQKLTGGNI